MKKIIVLILYLFVFSGAYSQLQAFNWLFDGDYMSFVQPHSLDVQFPKVEPSDYFITTNNSTVSDINGLLFLYSNDNTLYNAISDITYSFENSPSENQPVIFVCDTFENSYITSGYYLENISTEYELHEITYISNFNHSELFYGLSSKMTAYNFNDGYYNNTKTVCHSLGSTQFNTYESGETYFNYIGPTYGTSVGGDYDSGFMKFSPLGNYLAVTAPDKNDLEV